MNNKVYLLLNILIFTISCENYNKINEKRDNLFNGKNLNGWSILGKEKWYIKEGLLICETISKKDFGYLVTDKKYKNFKLSLDFKYETIGNSGVFLHSNFENKNANSWQVEIGPPGHKIGGIHKSSEGWLAIPDISKDSILKMDKWNTLKIILENDQLTSWLNGIKMSSVIDPELNDTSGNIALQIRDENAKIKWRNIHIVELKKHK